MNSATKKPPAKMAQQASDTVTLQWRSTSGLGLLLAVVMVGIVEAETKAPLKADPIARADTSARDSQPVSREVDRIVAKQLADERVPASPRADDAEFLRRVHLDITGRIPTYDQTVAFLASKDPNKRRKLIDELPAPSTGSTSPISGASWSCRPPATCLPSAAG